MWPGHRGASRMCECSCYTSGPHRRWHHLARSTTKAKSSAKNHIASNLLSGARQQCVTEARYGGQHMLVYIVPCKWRDAED
eukprot:6471663-Amphidinium_carterae.1